MRWQYWLMAVVLIAGACDSASGDVDRFCGLNTELEGFHTSRFLPLETRQEAGRPKLLEALRSEVVIFDTDDVRAFGEVFDEFVGVAPDEIRPSVAGLDTAISPLIEAYGDPGGDPTVELFEAAFIAEGPVLAGFEVEYWVATNCPG